MERIEILEREIEQLRTEQSELAEALDAYLVVLNHRTLGYQIKQYLKRLNAWVRDELAPWLFVAMVIAQTVLLYKIWHVLEGK